MLAPASDTRRSNAIALLAYSTSVISTRSPGPTGTAARNCNQARVALSASATDPGGQPSSRPIDVRTAASASARSAAAT